MSNFFFSHNVFKSFMMLMCLNEYLWSKELNAGLKPWILCIFPLDYLSFFRKKVMIFFFYSFTRQAIVPFPAPLFSLHEPTNCGLCVPWYTQRLSTATTILQDFFLFLFIYRCYRLLIWGRKLVTGDSAKIEDESTELSNPQPWVFKSRALPMSYRGCLFYKTLHSEQYILDCIYFPAKINVPMKKKPKLISRVNSHAKCNWPTHSSHLDALIRSIFLYDTMSR